ncbi:endolytic transglycosylase MltG [Rhizobium sp. RCAM05350]|nr:endolytic transglycosylase MltG [Rhizobium sp. RCAM05350]
MNDVNDNSAAPFGRNEAGNNGPIIPKSASEALRPEKVPQPPKRSRKAKSQVVIFLNFLMTVVVCLTIAAAGTVYYAMSAYEDKGPLTANTNFIVRSGAGIQEIAGSLERNNIVSDGRVFRFMSEAYLEENDTLKAGEYEIKAGSSMQEIMQLLKSGKSILYSVSLPEGLTVKQMFGRLSNDPVLEGDLPAQMPAEGTLRPDTYKFSRGTKRGNRGADGGGAEGACRSIWDKRDPDLPIGSRDEFVTLASIVEKETGIADERSRVASVFINRLEKGMRLQSDPTIIYGIFGGDGKPADRPILKSDLDKETPYNTYVIKGLPPTPIANPGRAALEAVSNPSRTSDLYFVADGTGGHVFAATLDEHNNNVRRWRKIEAERPPPRKRQSRRPPRNNRAPIRYQACG